MVLIIITHAHEGVGLELIGDNVIIAVCLLNNIDAQLAAANCSMQLHTVKKKKYYYLKVKFHPPPLLKIIICMGHVQ